VKQLGLVLLCAAWVALGLVGHDPWKTEDATTFGVAWDMMNGGPVLTPTLMGDPYAGHPPLVYAVAAFSGTLFRPWLAPHDAARLAAGLFLTVTIFLLAHSARQSAGRAMTWLPVLIFIGSIGLWDRSHVLSPQLGLLLGLALAQFGWSLFPARPAVSGAVIGLGATVAFLCDGFTGPLWIAATAALLPVLFAQWRSRSYAASAGVAVAVAAFGLALWPAWLAVNAPAHLAAWWQVQSVGNWFAPLHPVEHADPVYILKNIPWFTWPALPLALWTLWTRARGFNGGMTTTSVQIPVALSIAILIALLLMPDPHAIDVMMLILPLSMLGALEVDTLRRGFSGALDWFGILTFGLLGALAWWIWWDAYLHGMSPGFARALRDTVSGYHPSFRGAAVISCVLLTLLWLALVRPARRSNRRAILNWAAGTTLLWAMYMTIWLPYLDSRRSYRSVAEDAAQYVKRGECVESVNVGEPQRALFYYFGNIRTRVIDSEASAACPALLVQFGRQDALTPQPEPDGYTLVWQGGRRGDDTERFVLYARNARAAATSERKR
jgi:4-amino-4-deoxy-L-arabinose transferase-like glycosyltransferase